MPRGGDTPPPVGGQFDINVEVEICSDSLASLPWKAKPALFDSKCYPLVGKFETNLSKNQSKKINQKIHKVIPLGMTPPLPPGTKHCQVTQPICQVVNIAQVICHFHNDFEKN